MGLLSLQFNTSQLFISALTFLYVLLFLFLQRTMTNTLSLEKEETLDMLRVKERYGLGTCRSSFCLLSITHITQETHRECKTRTEETELKAASMSRFGENYLVRTYSPQERNKLKKNSNDRMHHFNLGITLCTCSHIPATRSVIGSENRKW